MLISGNATAIVPNIFQRILNFQYSSGMDKLIAKSRAKRACLICVGINTVIQMMPEAMNRLRPQLSHCMFQVSVMYP